MGLWYNMVNDIVNTLLLLSSTQAELRHNFMSAEAADSQGLHLPFSAFAARLNVSQSSPAICPEAETAKRLGYWPGQPRKEAQENQLAAFLMNSDFR